MKKCLIIVFFAMLAIGCKKESELSKFNNSIQGTWKVQSNKLEYYSGTNQKTHENVLSGDGTFKEITFSENLTAGILVYDNSVISSRYDIINTDGKRFVEFNSILLFDTQYFELASSSKTAMTWKVKFTDIQYEDDQTGETVLAPYAILTIQLNKN